jgi:ubiquitin-protein ligase
MTAAYIRNEFDTIEDSDELDDIGCSIGLKNEYDVYHWKATFIGPDSSAYHGGLFRLSIDFPNDYPTSAPSVFFSTKIYHPNVDYNNGRVCIEVLNNWNRYRKMSEVLTSIYCLLIKPNPESPLNSEAAELYKRSISEYNRRVNQDVRAYALV